MPCSMPGYEDILRKYKNKDEFTRRYTVIKGMKTTKSMCTFQSVAYIDWYRWGTKNWGHFLLNPALRVVAKTGIPNQQDMN